MPKKRETNEVSSIIAAFFCLEAISRPQERERGIQTVSEAESVVREAEEHGVVATVVAGTAPDSQGKWKHPLKLNSICLSLARKILFYLYLCPLLYGHI